MGIQECAERAKQWWDPADATIMVAIAGGESGWREDAHGDHLSHFEQILQDAWRAYACDGYLSWGWYQIMMAAHYTRLTALTGRTEPCDWAEALKDGDFNTYIAYLIWQGVGFTAWSVYNNGAYMAYLAPAELAVGVATGEGVSGFVDAVDVSGLELVEPPADAVEPPSPAIQLIE